MVSVPVRGSGRETRDLDIGMLPDNMVSIPVRGSGRETFVIHSITQPCNLRFRPREGKWS